MSVSDGSAFERVHGLVGAAGIEPSTSLQAKKAKHTSETGRYVDSKARSKDRAIR